MGMFAEMLEKMRLKDREARFKAKTELMLRHEFAQSDLDKGLYEIREEGPFGRTTVKLYKLVDQIEVVVEGMVKTTSI